MKYFFLIILIPISASVHAQTTKKTAKDKQKNLLTECYVLSSNQDIKEGPYTEKALQSGVVMCEGFYKNNMKDSAWTYYGYNYDPVAQHSVKYVDSKGSYRDDKKVGVWDFYSNKSERETSYDYTNKKLLFYTPSPTDTAKQAVINGVDTVKMKLDHPPIYLEGMSAMTGVMARNLRYPAEARKTNVQGKVLIAFTVDAQGKVSNYRIKRDIGQGCGEAALNAIKLIDGEWLPGELNGKAVSVEYVIPVSFTIETNH